MGLSRGEEERTVCGAYSWPPLGHPPVPVPWPSSYSGVSATDRAEAWQGHTVCPRAQKEPRALRAPWGQQGSAGTEGRGGEREGQVGRGAQGAGPFPGLASCSPNLCFSSALPELRQGRTGLAQSQGTRDKQGDTERSTVGQATPASARSRACVLQPGTGWTGTGNSTAGLQGSSSTTPATPPGLDLAAPAWVTLPPEPLVRSDPTSNPPSYTTPC